MKRRWVGGLVGLLGIATGSYAFSLVAATPEEMIRRPFACPEQAQVAAKDFQVLAVRNWQEGVVALYRGTCPATDKRFASEAQGKDEIVLSYRVVKRDGMEWQLSSSGNYRLRSPQRNSKGRNERLIEYSVGRNLNRTASQKRNALPFAQDAAAKESQASKPSSPNPRDRYAVFFGQVLSPKVATVEVTFNNGKILRDNATDSLFLLVAPGATGVCDVRVLGIDKQILQRDEIISPEAKDKPHSNRCQPISGQL